MTRIPVRLDPAPCEKELGASVQVFPLAGVVVGLAMALADLAFRTLADIAASLPSALSAALSAVLPTAMRALGGLRTPAASDSLVPVALGSLAALIANVLVTGGLHLDGLADTADGLAGGRDRERALAVMKDSRVGALGVVWLAIDLISRFALVTLLHSRVRLAWLLLAPVAGRLAQAIAIVSHRYARESGTGRAFAAYARPIHLVPASLISVLACLPTGVHSLMWLAIATLVGALFAAWLARRLGGLTGDTYGAISEIAEITFLLGGVIVR
jgi:adenosylcobinamide-GDP ribazoletransferase